MRKRSRVNHGWSHPKPNSNGDIQIATCLKCGCVREFIQGVPVYKFDNRQALHAPECVPKQEFAIV